MKIPLLLSFFLSFYSLTVHALPEYSLKERIRCSQCHVNKAGGGPRNPRGVFYSKHNTLRGYLAPGIEKKPPILVAKPSVKEIKRITKPAKIVIARRKVPPAIYPPTPPRVVKKKVKPVPPPVEVTEVSPTVPWQDRLQVGANLRMWFNGNRISGAPKKFGLDQVEPSIIVDVNPAINVVFAYNFANPLLTAYGEYSFPRFPDAYFKIGSFHAPIGLPYPDYTALLKDRYDIGIDTRDVGIEIGYAGDLQVQLAFVDGARQPNRFGLPPFYLADSNFGYVGNISYQGVLADIPFLLGSSVLFERRIPPGVNPPGEIPVVSVPGTIAPGPASPFDDNVTQANTFLWDFYGQTQIGRFDLLGEIAFGQKTPYVINLQPWDSMAFYSEIKYRLTDRLHFAFRYDHFVENRRFWGTYVQRFVPFIYWQFAEYASATLMYRNTSLKGNAIPFLTAPRTRNDNFLLWFHFWL